MKAAPSARETADLVHSAAIHLLRRVREEDRAVGISASRLSALSVCVFGGPLTLTALAAAEHVTLPTMSRLVAALEADGLVRREPAASDRRAVRVRATAKGRRLLERGRERRLAVLEERLATLPPDELAAVHRAAELLEGFFGRRRHGAPAEAAAQSGSSTGG